MVDDNALGYQRSKGEKKPAQRGLRWYRSVYEVTIMRALASFADDDGGAVFRQLRPWPTNVSAANARLRGC
jgi:hypothetical protein